MTIADLIDKYPAGFCVLFTMFCFAIGDIGSRRK